MSKITIKVVVIALVVMLFFAYAVNASDGKAYAFEDAYSLFSDENVAANGLTLETGDTITYGEITCVTVNSGIVNIKLNEGVFTVTLTSANVTINEDALVNTDKLGTNASIIMDESSVLDVYGSFIVSSGTTPTVTNNGIVNVYGTMEVGLNGIYDGTGTTNVYGTLADYGGSQASKINLYNSGKIYTDKDLTDQILVEDGYTLTTTTEEVVYESVRDIKNEDFDYLYTLEQIKESTDIIDEEEETETEEETTYTFPDVLTSAWYYEAVEYCYTNKIILGFEDSTFRPGNNITRGQLVTILWRMEDEPDSTSSESPYSDLSSSSYYYDAVLWAAESGVVNGYKDRTFKGDESISRQQIIVILKNYADYKEIDTSNITSLDNFADSESVTDYAVPAMQWAAANGVINGKTTEEGIKYLDPLAFASRAEAAGMVYNYCTEILE